MNERMNEFFAYLVILSEVECSKNI